MSVVTRKIALLKTQEYFNKISSVSSDIKDKRSVFNFVEGIHDLGLWDSMVCWPLRSSQNAGVGNTAFSLGGLGTYDSTLVNGPTWDTDGIELTNNYIAFPSISDFSSGIFTGSVHKVADVLSNNRSISIEKASGQIGGMWAPFGDTKIYWDCLDYTSYPRSVAFSGALSNVFYMWSGTSNSGQIILNKTSLSSGGAISSLTGNFDTIRFGSNGNTPVFNGTASFVFIVKLGATISQVGRFYDLYKSTLGKGLGLP